MKYSLHYFDKRNGDSRALQAARGSRKNSCVGGRLIGGYDQGFDPPARIRLIVGCTSFHIGLSGAKVIRR
jgi:hypothetical protein